jgi:HEAT repeat protein
LAWAVSSITYGQDEADTGVRTVLSMRPILLVLLLALPLAANSSAVEFDDRFVHPMFHDPELTPPGFKIVFYDNLRPVWFAALLDDDPELRRLAAGTIAVAHRKGMRGLEEAESVLVELLQREDSDPRIRRAAAKAIVEIDAKDAADVLAQHLRNADLEYAQVVEPALARWNYVPMVEQWLSRLQEPATGRVRLLLAFQCLAVVGEQTAREQLIETSLDPNELTTIRLAAARAASDIDRVNLMETSASLLSRGTLVDRLVGTTLLRRHSSEQAIKLLQRSAVDQAPTVAGLALRVLFEIDPKLVSDHAAQAVQHPDVNIRRVCAEALVVRGDARAIELLAPLLDDPHRGLRRYVSDQLAKLAASDELRKTVIAEASKVASTERWRGLEQALSILGRLDHEPSANRMLKLLHHERPEVGFAAAWALQEIALAEVLPEMLAYASDNCDNVLAGTVPHAGIDLQLAQLCQAFGKQRYAAAEPLMRKFVPKVPTAQSARSAAIWALGLLHENKAPQDLPAQLVQRLSDINPLMPEDDTVRRMSAITLARMQSNSALKTLRKFAEDRASYPALACIWAVEALTGEELPRAGPVNVADSVWFLAPIKLAEPVERADPSERANR